jgi:hypothetical protein
MSGNSTSAIYQSTYYLGIVYVKLATERKLCGVSTYLLNPEVLCLECIWNTHSATTISSPRPRPLGGQKYIPMSPLNSGILLKTWEHSGGLYGLPKGLADDTDYIPCFL